MTDKEGPRVLIVEDDCEVAELITAVLGDSGYDTEVVTDGASGLEAATRERPSVILLDVYAPVLNGSEFAAAYRETPGPHAPIVVVSAAADASEHAAWIGASALLLKPFDLCDLLNVVGHYSRPN